MMLDCKPIIVVLFFHIHQIDSFFTRFKIEDCSISSDLLVVGSDVEFECYSNILFGYCTLTHKDSNKSCFYTANHEKSNDTYFMLEEKKCKFSGRIEFVGNITAYRCAFRINNLTLQDSGSWTLTMKRWDTWGNNHESTSLHLKVFGKRQGLYYTPQTQKNSNDHNSSEPEPGCRDEESDFKSDDREAHKVNDVSSCQSKCNNDSRCQAWTYIKDLVVAEGNNCFLKNVSSINNRTYNNNTVSGQKNCPGCFLFGYDLTPGGKTSEIRPKTFSSCQEACLDDPLCYIFQWVESANKCLLFDGSINDHGPAKANTGSVIGLFRCSQEFDLSLTHTYDLVLYTSSATDRTRSNFVDQRIFDDNEKGSLVKNDGVPFLIAFVVLVLIMVSILSFWYIRKSKKHSHQSSTQLDIFNYDDNIEKETRRPIPIEQFVQGVFDKIYPEVDEYPCLQLSDDKYNVLRLNDSEGSSYSSSKRGMLNRYGNIIPYNHNRVKLINPIFGCDYVNASWISNESPTSNDPTFIAAQGPMEHTVPHFLQMILDHQIKVIVMLTQLNENTQAYEVEKCFQYWPDFENNSSTFDHLEIQLKSEVVLSELENTTLRIFNIADNQRNINSGPVYQYQINSWKDFGVPPDTEQMLNFVMTIKAKLDELEGLRNVLVHCSAGVGRTGTLIALYILMSKVDSGQATSTIDVYNEVFNLRGDRCYMVQMEEQYNFLYKCVASYLRLKYGQQQFSGRPKDINEHHETDSDFSSEEIEKDFVDTESNQDFDFCFENQDNSLLVDRLQ